MVGALAAAYAEAGRFTDAIAAAQKAVGLARVGGDAQFAAVNEQLLQLYSDGEPYHMPAATAPRSAQGEIARCSIVTMVYVRRTDGVRMVYGWCTSSVYLVLIWRIRRFDWWQIANGQWQMANSESRRAGVLGSELARQKPILNAPGRRPALRAG